MQIVLNGQPLGFADMMKIGNGEVEVAASAEGMERVKASREVLEEAIRNGVPVYGSTTGVGAMKDVSWSDDELEEFNMGLVRAHHFGTGAAFPPSVVRKAIAIRINTILTGQVGCTTGLVDAYLDLMRADVVPVVRRTGSIGCADIGLMGQIGAVLTGVGEAMYQGKRMPASEALKQAGLKPHRMAPRDALASLSANAVSFAAAARALRDAASVIRVMLATSLTASGALGASPDPWLAACHVGTPREALVGKWYCDAAASWQWPVSTHVQDPLSLRMVAQVFGTIIESLLGAGYKILQATGRSDDNPVVVEGRVVTSGGSLPLDVTVLLESVSVCMAHAARNAFNRCVLLGNGHRRGLPLNLVPEGKIATGFGPIIKLAGEIFSRVLSLSHPVSAQSLVVAGGMEDEAAFLPLVIERFERQVEALKRLAALEALLASQAIDIVGDEPKGVAGLIYEQVRKCSPFYDKDRPLSAEVECIEELICSDAIVAQIIDRAPINSFDSFFALGTAPEGTPEATRAKVVVAAPLLKKIDLQHADSKELIGQEN